MYLIISYFLLPSSPTLLTSDEVLLRVGGTRLRVQGCVVHVGHVVEVVLHDTVALWRQAGAYDVELLLGYVQDLGHDLGLLVLVDRGVELVVEFHLALGRRRGLHTALTPADVPLSLYGDVLPAAVPGPHRRVGLVGLLALVEDRAVLGLDLHVNSDLLPVLLHELEGVGPGGQEVGCELDAEGDGLPVGSQPDAVCVALCVARAVEGSIRLLYRVLGVLLGQLLVVERRAGSWGRLIGLALLLEDHVDYLL